MSKRSSGKRRKRDRVEIPKEILSMVQEDARMEGFKKPDSKYLLKVLSEYYWNKRCGHLRTRVEPGMTRCLTESEKDDIQQLIREIETRKNKRDRGTDGDVNALYCNLEGLLHTTDWHLTESLYGFLMKTFELDYSQESADSLFTLLGYLLWAGRFDSELREKQCNKTIPMIKERIKAGQDVKRMFSVLNRMVDEKRELPDTVIQIYVGMAKDDFKVFKMFKLRKKLSELKSRAKPFYLVGQIRTLLQDKDLSMAAREELTQLRKEISFEGA